MDADAGLGLLVLGIIGYFAPLIVALGREHHQRMAIGILNVFGGWTIVGWIVALVWASMSRRHDAQVETERLVAMTAEVLRRTPVP